MSNIVNANPNQKAVENQPLVAAQTVFEEPSVPQEGVGNQEGTVKDGLNAKEIIAEKSVALTVEPQASAKATHVGTGLANGISTGATVTSSVFLLDKYQTTKIAGEKQNGKKITVIDFSKQIVKKFPVKDLKTAVATSSFSNVVFFIAVPKTQEAAQKLLGNNNEARFVSLVASGAIEVYVTAPAQLVKTTLYAAKPGEYKSIADCVYKICLNNQGQLVQAFYRGSLMRVVSNGIYNVPYFMGMDKLKQEIEKKAKAARGGELTMGQGIAASALSGAVAGSATSLLSYPTFLIGQKQRLGAAKGINAPIYEIVLNIAKQQGVKGFYDGYAVTPLRMGIQGLVLGVTLEGIKRATMVYSDYRSNNNSINNTPEDLSEEFPEAEASRMLTARIGAGISSVAQSANNIIEMTFEGSMQEMENNAEVSEQFTDRIVEIVGSGMEAVSDIMDTAAENSIQEIEDGAALSAQFTGRISDLVSSSIEEIQERKEATPVEERQEEADYEMARTNIFY